MGSMRQTGQTAVLSCPPARPWSPGACRMNGPEVPPEFRPTILRFGARRECRHRNMHDIAMAAAPVFLVRSLAHLARPAPAPTRTARRRACPRTRASPPAGFPPGTRAASRNRGQPPGARASPGPERGHPPGVAGIPRGRGRPPPGSQASRPPRPEAGNGQPAEGPPVFQRAGRPRPRGLCPPIASKRETNRAGGPGTVPVERPEQCGARRARCLWTGGPCRLWSAPHARGTGEAMACTRDAGRDEGDCEARPAAKRRLGEECGRRCVERPPGRSHSAEKDTRKQQVTEDSNRRSERFQAPDNCSYRELEFSCRVSGVRNASVRPVPNHPKSLMQRGFCQVRERHPNLPDGPPRSSARSGWLPIVV